MRIAAALLLLPLALDARDTSRRGSVLFKYDSWEAWNSFREGSFITFEMDSAGTKYTITQRLAGKQADALDFEYSIEFNGAKNAVTKYQMKKPGAPDTAAECGQCHKPMKDHKKPESKQSRGPAKVGDRNIDCSVIESSYYDCQGNAVGTYKAWYSKSVPGWIVKWESTWQGRQSVQVCTEFEKK